MTHIPYYIFLLLFLAVYETAGNIQQTRGAFNPRVYPKRVATCQAFHRGGGRIVDLDIHYVDINRAAKTTMLMVHGWPSLWSSWSNQIQEFQRDYHLVIPDLRGFGPSTHPNDVQTSGTIGDVVGDLICVLEHADVDSAICMGHDWGSQVCHEAARMRPDMFSAVVGITVPYIPSDASFVPTSQLVSVLPRLTYQLFFEGKTDTAMHELDQDIRRTIRATLRTVDSPPPDEFLTSSDSFMSGWKNISEIPPVPFFTAEEEDYFVEQYSIQGFKNTLQFYTHGNRHGSWNFTNTQGNHTIPQPVLSILPLNDPVADWVLAATLLKSADYLPRLTLETLKGAHWVHLEYPDELNAIIRRWLVLVGTAPR